MLYAVYKHIIDYILPKRCMACAELTQDGGGFCSSCWREFEFITKPFCISCGRSFALDIAEGHICLGCLKAKPHYDSARSLFKFNAISKKVIHAFKYYDKTILATNFAEMLCLRYMDEISDANLIIPVPMHKLKRLMRMYNQAALLASAIGAYLQKPVSFNILKKTKWTKPQTLLPRKSRLTNIAGSIAIENSDNVIGKNIILIDDVMTTGTTISLCAKLLKKAGAKKIVVLCIAST